MNKIFSFRKKKMSLKIKDESGGFEWKERNEYRRKHDMPCEFKTFDDGERAYFWNYSAENMHIPILRIGNMFIETRRYSLLKNGKRI